MESIKTMDFVKCNFCQVDVAYPFMTNHINVHIKNKYVSEAFFVKENKLSNIVKHNTFNNNQYAPNVPIKISYDKVNREDVVKFLNIEPISKIKEFELFSFRNIKDISFISTSNKSGRYSDITIVVWFNDKTVQSSDNNNLFLNKVSEQIKIHIVYDLVENLFIIDSKLYKGNGYSDYYINGECIPTRVCYQDELFLEIKKILLFFKISPKSFLKRFIKIMKKETIIFFESKNIPPVCISVNYNNLLEEEKHKTTSYFNINYDIYD